MPLLPRRLWLRLWPVGVLADQVVAAYRQPQCGRIRSPGPGQRRQWPYRRYVAAERALQAVLELRRREWLRQAEGVLGDMPHPGSEPRAQGKENSVRPERSGAQGCQLHASRDWLSIKGGCPAPAADPYQAVQCSSLSG